MIESIVKFLEAADIETSSDEYATRFAGPVGAWFLRIQREATLMMLSPHPGSTILDVGGGHGQLTETLLTHGFTVTVLGSAEICVARIRQFVDGQRCSFKVGDILNLPYPNQAFDIVISYRLLPHVARWKEFLAELTRVARQVVIVDYPDVRSINSLTPIFFSFKKSLEGNTRIYNCFREADLLKSFAELGYQRADRYAEFFIPMVLHRMMGAPGLSAGMERVSRLIGLTGLFGSPVILKLTRRGG